MNDKPVLKNTNKLMEDIRNLIAESRSQIARTVNSAMVLLYWNVGKRIHEDILHNDRAKYGEQIVSTLSKQLTVEYGKGFGRRNLFNMLRFAEIFPSFEIVQTLSAQLSWSHFIEVIYLKDQLQIEFYAEMCRIERWSVRTLRAKIQGMLFERTAISNKPDTLIKQEISELRDQDRLTPDLVFRDPYFLDFLGLSGSFNERDLEQAILRELESFLMELGSDFAFIARQKRITIDNDDYYIDLLFYHRKLKRLVAIDLKLGKFKAEYKGQMELYLRWLEKYEMQESEDMPIGLILCTDKSEEHIQLLRLDKSGIRVARYLTQLPPKDVLKKKLQDAMILARKQIEARLSKDST